MNQDVIHLLPENVANQIAAGEVIQRPASVVKELVENSVDAGATSIEIIIQDAGKTLIQVVDNGCGMSETDARMAFERHATSKISCADDLFTLHPMGFRCEALPSIAAVSEIEMRTMPHGQDMGTRLILKASQFDSQEAVPCRPGTSIMVKRLFYNFVARRRFLKKDTVEFSHIIHEFERLALVNTGVALKLTHNGTVVHQLTASALSVRIGQLFGRAIEQQLIPIEAKTALVNISGYVTAPAGARRRNHLQYFFVNGRNMKHLVYHKAVLQCFSSLLPQDAQPNYFINFEVDPHRIDVNVHPQKHEIKFEDEQMIWQVLTAAIRESLGKFNVGPAIDFEATDVPDIPPLQQGVAPTTNSPLGDEEIPDANPFELQDFPDVPAPAPRLFDPIKSTSPRYAERSSSANLANWEKLYDTFAGSTAGKDISAGAIEPMPEQPEMPTLTRLEPDENFARSLFQLRNRWIVTVAKNGLMLIDQHRAHLRILYDRMLPQIRNGAMTSQKLIFPEQIEVEAATDATLGAAADIFRGLGFELVSKGERLWEIAAVPGELSANPKECLLAIATDLAETGNDPGEEQRSRIALSLARMSSIRNNQPLGQDEMQTLTADLFRCPEPNYTPDGLPVVQILSAERIAQMFYR